MPPRAPSGERLQPDRKNYRCARVRGSARQRSRERGFSDQACGAFVGAARELDELLRDAAFENVRVDIVVQRIAFPSVLDYVRFQLLATPMAALLGDRPESERKALIDEVASQVGGMSDPTMLKGSNSPSRGRPTSERLRLRAEP